MTKIESIEKEVTQLTKRQAEITSELYGVNTLAMELRSKMGECVLTGGDSKKIANELRKSELRAEALQAGLTTAKERLTALQDALLEAKKESVKADVDKLSKDAHGELVAVARLCQEVKGRLEAYRAAFKEAATACQPVSLQVEAWADFRLFSFIPGAELKIFEILEKLPVALLEEAKAQKYPPQVRSVNLFTDETAAAPRSVIPPPLTADGHLWHRP